MMLQRNKHHFKTKEIINLKQIKMKNIFKTMALSIFVMGAAQAQTIVDEANITTTKEYEVNGAETMVVKTKSSEERVLMFDPADKGELNQNLIDAPVMVEKTIWIDNDNDSQFEKEIKLTYEKEIEENLAYQITPQGLAIQTLDNKRVLFAESGSYELDSKMIEEIDIEIEEINTDK